MHRGIDLPHLNGHIHTTPTSTQTDEIQRHRLTARLHRLRYFSRFFTRDQGCTEALRSPRKNHTNGAPSSASAVIVRNRFPAALLTVTYSEIPQNRPNAAPDPRRTHVHMMIRELARYPVTSAHQSNSILRLKEHCRPKTTQSAIYSSSKIHR